MSKGVDSVFANNLMELRKKLGFTRSELARRLGVNINTFTNYELSGREPKYSLLIKIADFFQVSVDELIRQPINFESYILRHKHRMQEQERESKTPAERAALLKQFLEDYLALETREA